MELVMSLLFFSISSAQAQTVEPPVDADEFGWLRWAVIILSGLVLTGTTAFFAFIKLSFETRITDKDEEIKRLTHSTEGQAIVIAKLQSDKDSLNKDMQDKVIPALTSASDLIRTFLNSAR